MMIKYLEKKLYEQTKAESIKFSARKMVQNIKDYILLKHQINVIKKMNVLERKK